MTQFRWRVVWGRNLTDNNPILNKLSWFLDSKWAFFSENNVFFSNLLLVEWYCFDFPSPNILLTKFGLNSSPKLSKLDYFISETENYNYIFDKKPREITQFTNWSYILYRNYLR